MTILSSISIVHLNVLEKELNMLENRKKRESIDVEGRTRAMEIHGTQVDFVINYFEQRIKEINKYNF